MLKFKMQLHQNILNTLEQLKIRGLKIINAIMNDMGMNHSLHIGTYAECIKFHAISTFLNYTPVE